MDGFAVDWLIIVTIFDIKRSFGSGTGARSALLHTTAILATLLGTVAVPALALAQVDPACGVFGAACVFQSTGANGSPAKDSNFDGPGHTGGLSSPGTGFTGNFATPALYRDQTGPAYDYSPIEVRSTGGAGSTGSNAGGSRGAPEVENQGAGDGTYGGAAGSISVTTTFGVNALASGSASGVTLFSQGGAGGGGGYPTEGGHLGISAVGGDAGAVTATIGGSVNSENGTGIYAESAGGVGGSGSDYRQYLAALGPDGANGGAAGLVAVTVASGSVVTGSNYGVLAISAGGSAGRGGDGNSGNGGNGGIGGNGATGGAVTVIIAAGSSITASGEAAAGVLARSIGGLGGAGGGGIAGGAAGRGADGGRVVVQVDGTVNSRDFDAAVILAQSLGGSGASGGDGGGWGGGGGDGGTGGNGGAVIVIGNGGHLLSANGFLSNPNANSPGILAQSIGGGGGAGGNSIGWASIGGSGATAANGGSVSVDVNDTIATSGPLSHGIEAQSIGGGGGNGGDAAGEGIGINLVIGGGGGGGAAGTVLASSAGLITTIGDHSTGMLLQSIGGGGGSGGSAYAAVTSAVFGASMSVGGTGGDGGNGGIVGFVTTATNTGRIITQGSDSFGIEGQSIGGGGGIGGASTAKTITEAPPGAPSDTPSIALSLAVGGSGGIGGDAGTVDLLNGGLIATSGAGATGMLGQSVGGGGGSGGDASAASTAKSAGVNFAAAMSFGGKGKGGGNGNVVTVANTGMIVTTGETADGMLVQSIGGGGGNGGSGDGQAASSGDGTNISMTLNMGGSAGSGGTPGNVNAINGGAILTLGDGASGVMAQAIGGGGGRGGGGAGTSSGTYTAHANVGGSGGDGGSAYYTSTVTVLNSGTILTFGADAPAIVAQSIGGGGGVGGKASSSIGTAKSTKDGGNGDPDAIGTAYDKLNSAWSTGSSVLDQYNSVADLTRTANTLLANLTLHAGRLGDDAGDLENTAESGGKNEDDSNATSVDLGIAVGGSGGSGGAGGMVYVTNTGAIATTGKLSDGILAQSIGGGGGKGGAATSSASNDVTGNLAVGGSGGSGGNGALANVNNSGSVITIGSLSAGIIAQSIGGGGGIGGVSGTTSKQGSGGNGVLQGLAISVGGDGGGNGLSEMAIVANSGSIVTKSHDSIGIIAQSIAGGGGIVKSLATDLDNTGGGAKASSSDYTIDLKFGGSKGSAGESGLAMVTNSGTITTSGADSYGILAQSIAGGGGLVLGGKPNGSTGTDFFGTGLMSGSVTNDGINDGTGNSGVLVSTSGAITTAGQGAVGIFAQSIGGGGGIAGDTGWSAQLVSFDASGAKTNHEGSGGYIGITVVSGGSIATSGTAAPAILAQSIGGGGGRVTNINGSYNGTAGGTGFGGAIDLTIDGNVQATGAASPGIYAQSVGYANTAPPKNAVITVKVGTGVTVMGGSMTYGADSSPGIYLDHGGLYPTSSNVIVNDGLITSVGGLAGTAIYSDAGWTAVTNDKGATIQGNIHLANNGGSGSIINNGSIVPALSITLGNGTLINNGTLVLGKSADHLSVLQGNLVNTGDIVTTANFVTGVTQTLQVSGNASVSSRVLLGVTGRGNVKPVTVLTAGGSFSAGSVIVVESTAAVDGTAVATPALLFGYTGVATATTLTITPTAAFASAAASLGRTQRGVAASLQSLFDTGADLDSGFNALAKVTTAAAYAKSLNVLSGQTLGALAAFRFNSSHSFVANMYSGCVSFDRLGARSDEANCGWARMIGSATSQSADADALGYTANAVAFQLGAQREIYNNWYLSGSLAYETSQFNGDQNSSKITGDSLIGGAYLRYHRGPLQVSAAVDVGYGWYDSKRFVLIGDIADMAKAKPEEWHAGLHGKIGYELAVGEKGYLQPFVDGHAVYVRGKSYAESGASPFNLAVEAQGNTALAGAVGLEIGGRMKLNGAASVRAFGSAAYEVLNNNDWTTTASFVGQRADRSFEALTPAPNRLGKFTVGLDLLAAVNADLSVAYTPEVGHGYVSHAGVARLSLRF